MQKLLHQRKRSKSSLDDNYETPAKLFKDLCKQYHIRPKLDVCATKQNTKCINFFDKRTNGLELDWILSSFCNPPHSETGLWVKKAFEQHIQNNIDVMLLIPANTMSSHYWHTFIEDIAEYHAIQGRIRFLINGKPSSHSSRNAYVCVIYRKRIHT